MTIGEAGSGVTLNHAFGDFEGFERHNDRRHVRPSRDLLAIAAMTFEHHQGFGITFVADFATNTAAGNGKIHGIVSSSYSGNCHCRFASLVAMQKIHATLRQHKNTMEAP